ncbi:MAG: DUF3857 domain-containing protein, partial [Planctomycetota bacterium]
AYDRSEHGQRLLAGEVRDGASRLAQLDAAGRGAQADRLADELELILATVNLLAAPHANPPLVRSLLEGILVDPRHGMLFARLTWTRRTALEHLYPLLAWEFVGPFDNERGQGMLVPTAAEREPTAESYAGKVREVVWRELPAMAPADGIVRFRRLIDPHTQSCVVARTWIHSETAREVWLMLGAGEELRVWQAGEPLALALGARDLAPDTFVLPLVLEAGWNEIALKVGSLDGGPAFVARLVEPGTATPLELTSVGRAPQGVVPKELRGGQPVQGSSRERPGAWERFARGTDAESLFRRALLEIQHRDAPRHLRPGSDSIRRACESTPGKVRYDLLHISTLRERGALRQEEDVNPWLAAIDAALQRHGDLPALLLWRARHSWENQPTYRRALELVGRALAGNPDSLEARAVAIMLLGRMGQKSLAQAAQRQLAADPALRQRPGMALEIARRLRPSDALRGPLLESAAAAGLGDALDLLASADRLRDEDRTAAATLDVLRTKLALHPWSTTARRAAAETLVAQGHAREALVVLQEALGLAPERAALHRWRARAYLALGDTELAALALEEELAYEYGADDERRLLEHLRATGGVAFHTAFQEPLAQVLERRAGDTPADPKVSAREILLQRTVVEVNPDGTAKRYHRTVERVLSEAGARELDRRGWRAWSGEEEVRLLSATVQHPDGSQEQGRTGRSGRRGFVQVDLPPLAVGDIVDLEWRRDDLRPSFFGSYFGLDAPLTPHPGLPVRESEVVLIVPDSFPLYFHERGFEQGLRTSESWGASQTLYRWHIEDLEPRRLELLMPPSVEDAPAVQASSYASWEEFGAWWWNLIEDEIRVSPEMRQKVTELTAGAETRMQEVRAIYDFVVTDVRYNAWEFGVHGYQPYSAPVIFSRRFGDCKDKAILLRALLSVADIEAWPVLIRAEGRRFEEDHTLAMVGHFNHCIAWLPEQEGVPAMYLDGTARLHPLDVLPSSDNGARVVIVRDDGVQEARVPFTNAAQNIIRHRIRVDLTGRDGPRVEYERISEGIHDPRDRHHFTGSDEERVEKAEALLTSMFGALRGEPQSEFPDFEDLSQTVRIRFETGVEKVSRPVPGGFELPTTFDALDLLRGLASETQRETDLLLGVSWSRETEIEYVLGQGHTVAELPEPVELRAPDATYRRTVERTTSGVRVHEVFTLDTHRVTTEHYDAFRALCRGVDDAQRATLRVEVAQ